MIGASIFWIVRFIMHRVLLVDLTSPLWSLRSQAPVSSGANLFMLPRSILSDSFFNLANYAVIDLSTKGSMDIQTWEVNARQALD